MTQYRTTTVVMKTVMGLQKFRRASSDTEVAGASAASSAAHSSYLTEKPKFYV